jgi:O-antigen ligase/Flp pilus assembly protein TadD
MAKALPPAASYGAAPVVNVTAAVWGDRLGPLAHSLVSLATVAFVGSWVGFYLITLWPSIALEAFRATMFFHIATGLVVAPYLVSLVMRRRLPGGSALDAPVVAALGAYLLATATSLNWRVSLENTLTILMAVSVFFVLSDRQLFRRRQVEIGVMLAAVAGAVWALHIVANDYFDYLRLTRAVSGHLSFSDYIPPTVPRVHDVGDHPNILAMALATTVPFFVVALFRRGDAPMRILGAVGLPIVALALFFTLSRGAWLGAFLGSALTIALMFAVLPGGRTIVSAVRAAAGHRLGMLAAIVAIASVAVIVASGVVLAARSNSRPEWLFRDSTSPRVDMLTTGAEIFRDHPLLGTGPDVFGLLYPAYSGKNPRYHYHVHNGFFQTAIDAGVPGIVAMIVLGGTFGWMTLSRVRRAPPQTQLSLMAAAGGLVAFSVHSLVDAPNEAKTALAMLAALGAIAALAAGEADGEPAAVEEPRRIDLRKAGTFAVRAFVPIAMAGLLITWGRLDAAQYEYSNSLGNANAHRWTQSAEQARRAVELDPSLAIYRFQYGNVLAHDYLQTSQPALLADAVAELNRGLQLEPRSAIGHTNLALLYADSEQAGQARAEAQKAIRYANRDPSVVLAAGYALEKVGEDDAAIEAYATVLYFDVDLADSPFWRGTTFRQQHFDDIIGSSAIIFNACALLNLSNHGAPAGTFTRAQSLEACRQHVADTPADLGAKVTLAEALIRSSAPAAQSRALLDEVLNKQPDFGPALTALGLWYKTQGDIGGARKHWVRAGQLNETEALVMLGDTYPANAVPQEVIDALRSRTDKATSEVQLPLTTILYYRRSFYRGSPIDILLPGDWQTAMPGRFARALDALQRWSAAP